jgi:hypothetical protein
MSAKTTKRKRPQTSTHVEIISTQSNVAGSSSAVATARMVTYTRESTGHLREHSDTIEVHVSPEDLKILQNHPEFSVPSSSFLDFENTVQSALDNDDIATAEGEVVEKI